MSRLHLYPVVLAAALGVALLTGSCQVPSPPALQPSPAIPTAGQFAGQGKTVFATYCAKCHGNEGQGVSAPALIGANANLDKYRTGQLLLDYVSLSMPLDASGSLSREQYLQVVAFLVVQNGFVPGNSVFDSSRLDGIMLKKQ